MGSYFSIVEIIKFHDKYLVTINSTAWGKRKSYHKIDTLLTNLHIKELQYYCDTLYNQIRIPEKEIGNEIVVEEVLDDRDNLAFEWKYNNDYSMVEGIEVSNEFARVIQTIMVISGLKDYYIYTDNDEVINGTYWP